MTSRCVVALGANLGDRFTALQSALTALSETPGIWVRAVSPVVASAAVGGPKDSPDYLNAVAELETHLTPEQLLSVCQSIENQHGRERDEHWGPRTLDLDLVWFQDVTQDDPHLTLPHPRAHQRAFVLVPWVLMDPQARLGTKRVFDLAEAAPDRDGLRKTAYSLELPSAAPGTLDTPGSPDMRGTPDMPDSPDMPHTPDTPASSAKRTKQAHVSDGVGQL